ncbi:MAG: zinc-dependent metalloprotease [Betaproteobacteria bacterium]|nr:zinc-dependent metalloprotease [Betaproteobacteria bacterium]
MRTIVLVIAVLAALFCRTAFGAAMAVVSSCAPGKEPTKQTLVGMLTVHVICDRVIFEIPLRGLNRDILVNTEFAALSTGSDFVAPGSVVDNRVVRLIRLGNKIFLEDVRYEILAREQPNLQRGVEAASLRTVIRVFDIIGEGSGGEAQIDVTSVFTSEVPAGFALDLMRHFHMRAVDPKRSYVQAVTAFPGSIDVRFYQTWMADPAELRGATDNEDRPATLGFIFHASILALPQTPMRGRYADDRVGYFTVPFDDYGTGEHGRVRRAYIQRYRLEKKDPSAEVSEPVKPIVFYLSQEVPDRWRPYIKRGIEDWQKVFENAGFRNAILARDAPTSQEDPNWDPEDVRYNVVRWTPSGRQNAMGPAVIDPRSGEVISSHAIFWHDVLRLAETWYFTQVGPLDPRAQKLPLPEEITGEMLRYIVSHEIGHALGLRHNFKGHSAYTVAQLRSREWTEKWGNSASIMDYSRLNYVAQPEDNAYLLPKIGPYDYFAIEWGYKPFMQIAVVDGKRVTQFMGSDTEWSRLDQLAARQVTEPMLRFGGEDESAAVDPQVNTNVVGSDPIEAADLGLKNIDRVMPMLIPGTTQLGGSYARMAEMYETLITQRHRELLAVAKLPGGVEETRYQAGRGSPPPFQAVPATRQRAAVKFLLDRAFLTPGPLLDRDVLYRMAPYGGANALQGSNVQLLRKLIDAGVFERMAEARELDPATKGYTGIDMLYDLNDGLFRELGAPAPVIEMYRRNLQRNYVLLLLVAAGAEKDPQAASNAIDSRNVDSSPLSMQARHLSSQRAAYSSLSEVAQQYRKDGHPSEFRAALRLGAVDLHSKVDGAIGRVKHPATLALLRELKAQLERMP